MIYFLALLAAVLAGVIWRMWPRPVPMPQAEAAVEEVAPPLVSRDEFAFAHFNDSRRKYAADIDAEAQRLARKLEIVRQAMTDDIAAMQRMRADADAAKAHAVLMTQEKREAEQTLEAHRVQMQAAVEASQLAAERIDELNVMLGMRDGDIARSHEAMLLLEANYREAVQTAEASHEALARQGLSLNEAQLKVTQLETALFERDEEFAVQAKQIENLRAESAARRDQLVVLEARIATLIERFEDARRESQIMIGKLREGQQQASDRAEKLDVENETMRRHIGETERARDRLLGQVGQLRAENAGLRAEAQVKVRDLEALNNELAANVQVLERMLATARPVRAQPAPNRAHLRLIAEAKRAPGRAFGS